MASIVSIIIPTMNRGVCITPTIDAIFAGAESRFELIVADQSDDDDTRKALTPYFRDPRLKYIKVDRSGKTQAINQVANECSSPIILILDDDCIPQSNWVAVMLDLFSRYPRAGVAFCSVNPAPFDATLGFIPNAQYSQTREITSLSKLCWGWMRLESGMAVRTTAFDAIQGFDKFLGPGAPFVACEGPDLSVRAICKGFSVLETDETAVVHHGFYTFEQGRRITRRYWYGIGTASTKLARGVNSQWLVFPLAILLRHFVCRALAALLRLQRPRGTGGLFPFLKGVWDGMKTPLDRSSLLYQLPRVNASDSRQTRLLTETTPTVQPKVLL